MACTFQMCSGSVLISPSSVIKAPFTARVQQIRPQRQALLHVQRVASPRQLQMPAGTHHALGLRHSAGFICSAAAAGAETDAGSLPDLRELTKDDFYACLEEAGNKLVVVDFFTDWCGPCKVIYPMLQKMAVDQQDVSFVKMNCNKYNKDLGKALGVKVAPTFQLFKKSEKVAEMTGAKVDDLQALINEHK
mmetsp:Transcript_1102/g.3351  ORF Transcript_1102/g.3351 Transcript_1102/m.3351 type:complete len:191 (+) Transcript_1102:196-768(+)